jgi:hypothetical protein
MTMLQWHPRLLTLLLLALFIASLLAKFKPHNFSWQ